VNIVIRLTTTSFLAMSVFLIYADKAGAAEIMSEQKARLAAAQILKGDPYGQTIPEVLKTITSSQLVVRGSSTCGTVKAPQWVIHVSVPERVSNGSDKIEGDLVIDAGTGKMICAGLPFLD
jgi:hypothetical protein